MAEDGARQTPARSWFVATSMQDRLEAMERTVETMQLTAMTTLPRDVQDMCMTMADLVSRQNVVER